MGKKLSPQEAELYRRCDEVLHYIWDPTGVAGAPGARDEYYYYLPEVVALVRDQAEDELVDYLTRAEERMGMIRDPRRVPWVVTVLLGWREWIWVLRERQEQRKASRSR